VALQGGNDVAADLAPRQHVQMSSMQKLGRSGFLRGIGDVRIAHDPHRRIRTGPASFARVEAKATGRPGYAPGDLLKLYIYGYLNRI
jgi:hypothetical protein